MNLPTSLNKNNHIYINMIVALIGITVTILALAAVFTDPAKAAINPQINYQGKLTNNSNVAVADGAYDIVFKLYTQSASGTAIYTESWTDSALWTATGATTITTNSADCGGSGYTKIAYTNETREESVTAGQLLWNTTDKESAVITLAVPGSNYLCVGSPFNAWDNGDDLTNRIYVINGLFSVMMGTLSNLSTVDFNQTLYLGVKVGTDSEMIPRKILGAVPGAFEADKLDGIDSTAFLRSDTADTAQGAITFSAISTGTGAGAGGIYVNPLSATADYTLFGLAVNGAEKLKIDEDGDLTTQGDLIIDGGQIGISGDTDLLSLAANLLTVNGNITSSGGTFGNIQVGITGDNEIDTSSGNLILDSASGTVQITDNLDFDGSIIDFSTQNTAFTLQAATNALNIDSNTFVIDAFNDRVGIGTNTPATKLEVEIGSTGAVTGLLVDQQDLDQIGLQVSNAANATASLLDLDVNSVSGDIVNLDWGAARTQTGALIGTDLDFTNLTTDGTNYLYGLHINDPVSNTASTQYGVYVEGANWDYGIYSASDVYSSGLRAGNIQIGITGDNEIDTSSGNLILDSASGTVQLTDNLDFDGSIIDFSTQNTAFTLIAATNALNIDSNTLVIDASNDRVGIGTNTPTEKLEVAGNINPATTLAYNLGTVAMDTTADVTFTGAGGITNFDSLGISVASAGDVNGDGYNDVIVGAYGYFSFTGQAYIYYGGASMNNTADVTFTGAAVSDYFGGSVASAGDVNGDGFADVIVGAKGADGGGVNRGQAYIYYGGASMNNTADVTFTGAANSDWLGFSVAPAGDVNGDGYADVIVGALYASTNNGQAYIYYGGASMNNTADVTFTGAADNDSFGFSVAPAGDVNGDGYNDVIVGAKDASSTNGQAYIYYGGASMNNTADVTFTGVAAADDFGIDVASAGDVNGDGYNDVIVGAYLAGVGDIGEAYIYYGGVSMNNTADVTFTNAADTNIGKNIIASADDVNGDGYDDVMAISDGSAKVFYGGASMDNTADVTFAGADSVASAGDINSDGYPDLIVGNSSANGANGEAYIYQGSGNRWQSVFAQNFNASRGLQIGDVTLDRYNLLTNNSIFGITTPNWEMDKLGVGSLQDLFVANVITVSGSAEGTSALVLTAGDARVTNGDLIVTSGEASVTSSTTTSDVLALTSMADSTTGDIISITADKVSGTIIDIDISGTPTLTGNLTGMDMDLSTGSIVPGAFDLTALKLTLPSTGTGDHTFAKFIDGTTTLYDFDTTSGIFNVPVSFQSAGDVSLAYDLLFTNTSEAYIKSNGPLTLDIGDPNQNHDLTLKGSGTGSVVVQEDTTDNNTVDTYKGLSVAATSASDTDAVDTISGIYIDATQNDADANVYGIQVANLAGTAGTGVEYGIYQAGTGWDYGLYVEDQAYFGSNVRVGAAATNTDTLNVGGIMSMYETSGATMTTNFGKLYAKSADSKLYYMNDSGTEYDLTSIGDSDWTISGSNMYSAVAGNVGIGQATPTAKLEVEIASDGGSTGLLVDQKDLDQITAQLANASDATASILDLDVNSVSGDIVNLDWGAAKTQTGNIIGTDLDFTNLTTDGSSYLYGLRVNDPVSNTASTQYGVYVEGTNWDYGIYSASDIYATGGKLGNIQVGITGDNEIDTSSGNLTLDSASGTVTIDDVAIVTGSAEGSNALTITAGDLRLTDGDLIVAGGEASITSSTITSDVLALTSVADSTTGDIISITADKVSGTIIDIDISGTPTLTGNLTGLDMDLSTGSIVPGAYDLTALKLTLPSSGTGDHTFAKFIDGSTTLYDFDETTAIFNVPVSIQSAGDVTLAYDLKFTNGSAAYIKSDGPLYIDAGDPDQNHDLTLSASGEGAVIAKGRFAGERGSTQTMADDGAVNADYLVQPVVGDNVDDALLDTDPAIENGISGQLLIIEGTAAANQEVNLADAAGVQLGAANRVLGTNDTLLVYYNGTDWIELAYGNNDGADLAEYYWTKDTDLKPGDLVALAEVAPGDLAADQADCLDRRLEGVKRQMLKEQKELVGGEDLDNVNTEEKLDTIDQIKADAESVKVPDELVASITAQCQAENSSNILQVRKTLPGDQAIVGIVSSSPALLIGGEMELRNKNLVPVGLAGRVPVQVTAEAGPVKRGDLLIPSPTVPGAVMKYDQKWLKEQMAYCWKATSGTASLRGESLPNGQTNDEAISAGNNEIASPPDSGQAARNDVATKSALIASQAKEGETCLATLDEMPEEARAAVVERPLYDSQNIPVIALALEDAATGTATIMAMIKDGFLTGPTQRQVTGADNSVITLSIIEQNGALTLGTGDGQINQTLPGLIQLAPDGTLIINKLKTSELEVQGGITIIDRENGQPYCVFMSGGLMQTAPGKCLIFPAGLAGSAQESVEPPTSTPDDLTNIYNDWLNQNPDLADELNGLSPGATAGATTEEPAPASEETESIPAAVDPLNFDQELVLPIPSEPVVIGEPNVVPPVDLVPIDPATTPSPALNPEQAAAVGDIVNLLNTPDALTNE
ncbi:MAG: hypothetical protein A2445_05290 [Candidatus Jacksonbacteria bacterium RIFOXYC2_FULL_44_29]|nr:MAG: hypothetical protein A2240_02100 [Candidatus Jacksonbacteria bacterium RIFOXYA2_FULL_43_12]OGY77244.1 MAG: hypothetical protein A2445_05290 [Candidatus Jacksonbacteria bacterium RIFOXYC2_FULL_44_29]OGY78422.1 MAG: hypothetical protein A2550_06405 [Candidatus Jacksonbacteria bacterium RIFOXYD2_FULL_43_21]